MHPALLCAGFCLSLLWFLIMTVWCNAYILMLKREGQLFKFHTAGIILDLIATLYIISYLTLCIL